MDYHEYLSFAKMLALAAERPIMQSYQNCTVSIKADGTEVTEADHSAEQLMRQMIREMYPSHSVLGEEYGESRGSGSPFCWVLDPIDGTASFALGSPMFGTLVSLLVEDEPVIGVIHMPALGESVYAGKGLGCWYESRTVRQTRVHVRAESHLKEAMLSLSGIYNTDLLNKDAPYALGAVLGKARKFRFITDCIQHVLVCRGKLDAAIDTQMNPWDIAALVPCVEEAGGVATTLAGEREGIVFGGSLLTSCHHSLHNEILQLLSPQPRANPIQVSGPAFKHAIIS